MSFNYLIIPGQSLIALKFTGEITLEDVISGSEKMWGDPEYDKTFNIISDLSEITARAVPSDVTKLVEFYKRPETSEGSWAMIFSEPKSTALGFLFRSAAIIQRRIGVFSTWGAACQFLGVDFSEELISGMGFSDSGSLP